MAISENSGVTPGLVYRLLYEYYGPQGWWPVTRGRAVAPGYFKREYSLKSPKEKFEVCLGALLTQNTSWNNAAMALVNLNRAGALSPGRLEKLSLARVASLVRQSGYYNQKAQSLKCFAEHIVKRYGGDIEALLKKAPGDLRPELLSLKGVGPETADSIVLYAAGRPSFVADAYTLRMGQRLGWFKKNIDYRTAREYLSAKLPKSLKIYNEFHALIVALGKEFCRKKPVCGACPLRKRCVYEKKH